MLLQAGARARRDRLVAKITERDPEVHGLRTTPDVVEHLDPAPSQEPSE